MTAYLMRIELKQADGYTANQQAYDRLHRAIKALGLLRYVRSAVDGHIYKLPHATYAGDCDQEIGVMLINVRSAARNAVPDHVPRVVIGACVEMRISDLQRASRASVLAYQSSPFLVSC